MDLVSSSAGTLSVFSPTGCATDRRTVGTGRTRGTVLLLSVARTPSPVRTDPVSLFAGDVMDNRTAGMLQTRRLTVNIIAMYTVQCT